ncbi:DivIVA domain-containing protein [Schumannella sp. 10F1B-5-1]|uniref:DivIVA domain-containing protein n=1 Tax=Schumannella sp. 10F1B-5-1 TaxID=2590780 RepID=UPI00113067AA|nr:DivIVA domain-containing protein [Schumannella sp. 10F1B-5-1]TPW73812.1 DivIVA domain-containing protein [Schumannella sp. 10F1B-5-1]
MALSPEDVVNKRFNPTKFREGYDQDEVDDFLDEVVVELRRLNQENEELRQRLVAGEARINELQRSGSAPAAAPAAAPEPEVVPEPVAAAPEPVAAPVAAEAPAFAPTPVAVPEPDHVSDTTSTNNLLQLARRLHDDHVREGVEKRDALIAEGHATAARVVSDAQEQQRQLVSDAEETKRKLIAEAEETKRDTLGQLETQRVELESQRAGIQSEIDQLRGFESEYRTQLKSYIQGQLDELDAASSLAPESASGADGGAATPAAVPSFVAAPVTESAERSGFARGE